MRPVSKTKTKTTTAAMTTTKQKEKENNNNHNKMDQVSWIPGWPGTGNIDEVEVGLELLILLFLVPSVGIRGMFHHTQW